MNRRKIVIFCLIWCFADFNKCAELNDESQYGNSDIGCGSKVTTCTIVEESQIEKPPIRSLDIKPHLNEPQKRSNRGDSDIWKPKKTSKGKSRQRKGHKYLTLSLHPSSKSKKSSSAPSGAPRTSSKLSRKQKKLRRAASNLSSILSPPQASSKPSAQQSDTQTDPNDNTPSSEELVKTPQLETSTLPNRHLPSQSGELLLGKLISTNIEESSNQNENGRKDERNTFDEISSEDLEILSTTKGMEQRNQNTPAVASTNDSIRFRNEELKTFGGTRGKEHRTVQNENVKTSDESGIQTQDSGTFSATRGIEQRNEPNLNQNAPLGIRNRELRTLGATKGIDQRNIPTENQNTRTSEETAIPGQGLGTFTMARRNSGTEDFSMIRGLTTARKKSSNHKNYELLNELNREKNTPITFLPVDYQHISESDRAILKALNDDSLKYLELSASYADVSHLLNSNYDSIVIEPTKDDDLFVVEHEP